MVRVGGGWADLGEWLRNYAEHHGRRAASDGKIEVVGIGGDLGMGSVSTTPQSRRASLVSSIGSSALAGTAGTSSTSASFARSVTPSFDSPSAIAGTPKLGDELAGTPQSAVSAASTGTRSVSGGTGLMGPAVSKRKAADLDVQREEWVNGIVDQAKWTLGRGVEVGDLGKKGGTRRVFLKGKGGE